MARREQPASSTERASIGAELGRLEDLMRRTEKDREPEISLVDPAHGVDAINLVHYLALRHGDVRHLQRWLGARGLSSLGRCEAHVLATVQSVRTALDGTEPRPGPTAESFEAGRSALDRNTDALFGARPPGRVPRIMVTMPSEAADDFALVRRLVSKGMDVARINGAHDDPSAWERMAVNVRRASSDVGRPCRVSMDLPGPKMRTGPLEDGPRVVKLRPQRDLRGVAVVAATATLASGAADGQANVVPVGPAWTERRRPGDVVELVDARGSARQLHVVEAQAGHCEVLVWDTAYLETGLELSCEGDKARIGALPAIAQSHRLCAGDVLVLTRDLRPAVPWSHGQPGSARIGCTLPGAFDAARVGQRVILDDGKMTGLIDGVADGELRVRIVSASAKGSRLRAEKGINLPDTELAAAAVSDADMPLLEVAAVHADMIAVSFLRHERDVDEIHRYLKTVHAEHLGLVLKIETTAAYSRLPEILLHAMRSPLVGVMIARGDLAVEAGYDRLAELQEEILWICEAAHLPVIWATEVLDQLARTGRPSRAEVTDAAMGQRAECVMLNKGPHVDAAIVFLDDILRRMSRQQRKNTPLLQPIDSWNETATQA